MNKLKTFGIGLGLLLFILFAVMFFLPDRYVVSREIVVDRPMEQIRPELDDFHAWNAHWSPWIRLEPDLEVVYSGKEKGVGAKMEWKGKELGEGGMELVYSGADSVVYTMHFQDFNSQSRGRFELIPQGDATKVVWSNYGHVRFFERFFGLLMDGMMGPDFEQGLANLKTYLERLPKVEVPRRKHMEVFEGEVKGQKALLISVRCTESEIGSKLSAAYEEILAYMQQEKVAVAGPTFAVIHFYSKAKVEMEAGVPVQDSVQGEKRIYYKELSGGRAVQCMYRGDFANTIKAHEKIGQWMKREGRQEAGSPMEVYLTDPAVELDTAKLETLVVYPIR
jgi:effector-binding domain-containing protein